MNKQTIIISQPPLPPKPGLDLTLTSKARWLRGSATGQVPEVFRCKLFLFVLQVACLRADASLRSQSKGGRALTQQVRVEDRTNTVLQKWVSLPSSQLMRLNLPLTSGFVTPHLSV